MNVNRRNKYYFSFQSTHKFEKEFHNFLKPIFKTTLRRFRLNLTTVARRLKTDSLLRRLCEQTNQKFFFRLFIHAAQYIVL